MEEVEARPTLEHARALDAAAAEAVKGRRGDRYTRACAPDDGGWRRVHFVTRETGIRNIRHGRNKRMGVPSSRLPPPSPKRHSTLPSKVACVNVPL